MILQCVMSSATQMVLLFCTFLIAAFSDLALCSKRFVYLVNHCSLSLSFIINFHRVTTESVEKTG